ncbi:MAG TPA: archaea-specific SMC-related protein [Candidatus Methylomirabilis sp.]|nr:archaea-specific SMC-related protein [Candidatus Methylomirabilis sp.]
METVQIIQTTQTTQTMQIEAENLGGLRGKTKLEIKPGVNIIEAPNATGKTSMVGAFALSVLPSKEAGQHAHILHSTETEGSVRLVFGKNKIERIIKRGKKKEPEISGSSIASEDMLGLIRRFAVADENNPVIADVRAGKNLRDVLTEYSGVDLLKIQHKKLIDKESALQDKLRLCQEKVNRIDILKKNLKVQERRLEELESEKKELYERHPEKGEEIKLIELEGEIARIEENLKNNAKSIKVAESAIESREERLDAIDRHILKGTEEILKQIEEKELEKKDLEGNKKEIGKVELLKSNELTQLRFIDENIQAYAVAHEEPKDKLRALISDEGQTIICPVCDHPTEYGYIKGKLKKTAEEYKIVLNQVKEINEKISKLSREISGLKAKKDEAESMKTERKRILSDIETWKKQLSQKMDNMKALEDRQKELKDQKEKISGERTKEISEFEERKIAVEREIAITVNSIESIKKELNIFEPAASKINEIENDLADTENKIKSLADEIEEREKGIIKIFNSEIKNIYSKMGFEKVNEMRLDDNFNLKVIRLSRAGAGYADTVKSLSKTEKEVAGLILLLSGYRAFKIGEKYPFFVIDEISFMDKQRLEIFINHVKEAARSIVIMAIPGREVRLPGVNHIPLSA